MSAIWGVVDFQNKEIDEKDCQKIEDYYKEKKIDEIQSSFCSDFYLACGLQYVNKEAQKEQYPYKNEGHVLVADAIVDNRKELEKEFKLENALSKELVDGSVLFECITKDLEKSLDKMLGAYVFADYRENEKQLILANDALGNRSVYYMIKDERFYFSTMIEPLLFFVDKKKKNKDWLFYFFIQNSIRFVEEARETPFEGIYRLEPGEILTYEKGKLTRRAYWNPLKTVKKRKVSHKECAELVKDVFGKAVERVLREDKDAAILLSGGLDSNAVAAYAAPKLKEYGHKLYSFTSVPDAENPIEITRDFYVPDERTYVNSLRKYYSNLEPEWIGCNRYDIWKESEKLQKIFEIPFKSIPNLPWMLDAYNRAREKGCRTLLSGQYGNITVSFGGFECLFSTLVRQCRYLELYKQVCIYAKKYNKRRKWVFNSIWEMAVYKPGSCVSEKDTSPILRKEYEDEIRKMHRKYKFMPEALTFLRPYMYDRIALRQVGESEMKLSMETGVIPRDPTRDKRFIELVLSLPVECFVWDGIERRLVRDSLKDVVPKEITQNIYHRGRQGVGVDQSILEQWPRIKEELKKEFASSNGEEFLNQSYLLKRIEEPDLLECEEEVVRIIYCGLCSRYIGRNYDK